jgi:fatty acid desaturase
MEKSQIPPELYERTPGFFVLLLFVCWGLIALSHFFLIWTDRLWITLPTAICLGVMCAHAVELQHWTLHHTALAEGKYSPLIHRIVGIPLGLPMLVSYSHYRARHLEHHRWLGTSMDKEFFDYNRSFESWSEFLLQAFSPRRYVYVFQTMWEALRGRTCPDARSPEEARHIRQEYILMAALLVAAAGFSIAWHSLALLKGWVLPLLGGIESKCLLRFVCGMR